jgi:glutathione S-transferase
MRIYHRVGAGRPLRALWALEETELPYDLTILSAEEAKEPEHLARHPLGRVPVLETDDGTMLFESTALCLHIADLGHEAGLIGAPGSVERALATQWMIFAMTEIEPPLIATYRLRDSHGELAEAAVSRCNTALAVLDRALDGHDYLVADRFSIADIVAGEVVRSPSRLGVELQGANLIAYLDRLEQRPARQRAAAKIA